MKPKATYIDIPTDPPERQALVQDTSAFLEKRYGRPVSTEETREIIENIVGYFSLLSKWDLSESDNKKSSDEKL